MPFGPRTSILASTWDDGVVVVRGDDRHHELAGKPVRALAPDGNGGALAIVDGHSLERRDAEGEWSTLGSHEAELSCAVALGDAFYVGTDDAHVLRFRLDGEVDELEGFDDTPGRDSWYAGQAVINGQALGPPLGVRSISATCDGATLLANVHVGGIPRSTDGGATWHPTIEVDSDVHEVRCHPTQPDLVIAAAATGLCISRDAGATWTVEHDGLHATYCSAVAFAGNDILVAAAADHFVPQGAVYRRPINGRGPLAPIPGGFPRWIEGIADSGCIAARETQLAVIDKAGNLYVSFDTGATWSHCADGFSRTSSVLIV